jgi:uncharacterized membrane protein
VLSVAVAVLLLVVIVVAGVLQVQHRQSGDYPGQMVVGLVVTLLLCVDIVAVGLGIGAICQKASGLAPCSPSC